MNKTVGRFIRSVVALALAFGISSQTLASVQAGAVHQESQSTILISNVYYVSASGRDTNSGSSASPFKTFAKAVSMLAPGDTLQVSPGTYNETLNINKSGTAVAPITVIGNGAILNMQRSKNNGIKISGSYINLSGFEITGATSAGMAIPGKYITVKNNILHDNVAENGTGICGTALSWGSALKVGVGGEYITIDNNTVYNNCGEGIAVTRGVHVLVKNNIVYDNFAPNIYIDNSPYSIVQSNLVYCTGLRLRRDGRRPTAIGLAEEEYDGWGAQMHDVLVADNTIRDCGKGIGVFGSELGGAHTNVTITRNNLPSGEGRAISVTSELNQNVVISYNTVFNEIYLTNSAGITLIENTVIGNSAPTSTPVTLPTATIVVSTPTLIPTLPAATNTALPIPSNTPAATLTSIPSVVPSQPSVDSIFASGFESGNFSDWSGKANGNGDLSVSPSAVLVGSNGLQAVINDDSKIYVNDDSPNAEPRYRARFYFDPNSITMADGDAHVIFRGYSGNSTVVLRIEFRSSGGAYQIRAAIINDGSNWTNSDWFAISDAPHAIELDWRAATASGANNGGLTLWIDSAQQADLAGIDNDTRRIDRVRLGALAELDSGTSGVYYFDAFESRRQTYIGP